MIAKNIFSDGVGFLKKLRSKLVSRILIMFLHHMYSLCTYVRESDVSGYMSINYFHKLNFFRFILECLIEET